MVGETAIVSSGIMPATSSDPSAAAVLTFSGLGFNSAPSWAAKLAEMAAPPGTVLPVSTRPYILNRFLAESRKTTFKYRCALEFSVALVAQSPKLLRENPSDQSPAKPADNFPSVLQRLAVLDYFPVQLALMLCCPVVLDNISPYSAS